MFLNLKLNTTRNSKKIAIEKPTTNRMMRAMTRPTENSLKKMPNKMHSKRFSKK